jgi:hypothetical protein
MLIMKTRGMNMNNKIMGGLLGLVSLLIAGTANAATISVTPAVSSVAVGDPLALTVHGDAFDALTSGGGVAMQWNPASLQLNSTLADIEAQLATLGFFGFQTNFVNAAAGQLDLSFGTLGQAIGPTFDLFTLDFTAIPPPATSSIGIAVSPSAFAWIDDSGLNVVPVDYVGATVTVNGVATVPVPAAAWLFASGLLGLVGVARRRA